MPWQPIARRSLNLGLAWLRQIVCRGVFCGFFLCLSPCQADVLNFSVSGVNQPLLNNVQNRVNTLSVNDNLKLNSKRLKTICETAEREAAAAVRPFGYYHATVSSELQQQDDTTWLMHLSLSPGPPLKVNTVDIRLSGPGSKLPELLDWQHDWPMSVGKTVNQVKWEEQKSRALELATSRGFLSAQFTDQQIRANLKTNTAELKLHLETGPRAVMGTVIFEQDAVNPAILQGLPRFSTAQVYDSRLLEKFRNDVWQTGYFEEVEIIEELRLEESPPVVNLTVKASTRKPNTYQGTLGFGTDTGIRAQLLWTRRMLSSRGDSIDLGLGWQETNNEYSFRSSYRLPRKQDRQASTGETESIWQGKRQFWTADFAIRRVNQDLEITLDQDDENPIRVATGDVSSYSVRGGLLVLREFKGGYEQIFENWYAQYVLEDNSFQLLEQTAPEVLQSLRPEDLALLRGTGSSLALGVNWDWPSVSGSGFTTVGHREKLWLFTSNEAWGSDEDFSQAYFAGNWHQMLGEKFKLLLRGEVGYSDAPVERVDFQLDGQTAELSVTRLPEIYRFKAGGSRSVRGYSFESLTNNGIGSNNIVTASAEVEMLIRPNWSAAAFVDVGNAFNDWSDPDLKTGVGLGLRWYSIIGAVRLDVAHPLDLGGDPWRLHFTIGTLLF